MKKYDRTSSANSIAAQAQAFEPKVRNIAMVVYPGVEIIDVTGPLEVFSFANIGLAASRFNQ